MRVYVLKHPRRSMAVIQMNLGVYDPFKFHQKSGCEVQENNIESMYNKKEEEHSHLRNTVRIPSESGIHDVGSYCIRLAVIAKDLICVDYNKLV